LTTTYTRKMTDPMQRHISSLLQQDRPHSFFCIVTDNALAVNAEEARSTKMRPRRAKSTGLDSAPAGRPFNRTRSSPSPLPNRRSHSHGNRPEELHTASNSRWSSIPGMDDEANKARGPNKQSRRGLSKVSQEQLQKLASSRRPASLVGPPTKPIRKFLDDEPSFAQAGCAQSFPPLLGSDMSLVHCIAATNAQRRTKGVRTIRRPVRGTEETRRTIVDILDAALGSLDLDDAPAASIRAI
jgi:hypothetical protein